MNISIPAEPIRTAAVLGAGSMGAGIAAHLANAGITVLLFDVRTDIARSGVEAQIQRRGFMHLDFVDRVTPLGIDDDLPRIGEADWIVEAVYEDLAVKRDTYAKVAKYRRADSIVTSNTSTIPLSELVASMDPQMREHFLITHFFNPPRVMRLVEVVSSEETSEDVSNRITMVLEQQLGKVALTCRDTPGFIANRIGNYWMESAASLALDAGISIELADTIFSKPFGIPRTGVFGLFDYIGLQLVRPVWGSLHGALPPSDAYHKYDIVNHHLITGLVERGLTGRTGPSGFYRGRDEVIDVDFTYRPKFLPDDPALSCTTARDVMSTDSPGGAWALAAFLDIVQYCCDTAQEICESVEAIDQAMVLGYGWSRGPFALADAIGLSFLREAYLRSSLPVPALLEAAERVGGFYPEQNIVLGSDGKIAPRHRRQGVLTVAELASTATELFRNESAVIYGLPHNIALLEMLTPLNSIDSDVLSALEEVPQLDIAALIIATDNPRVFSAGADLATLAKLSDPIDIRSFVRRGADAMLGLRFAEFPVICAVTGLAVGGGAELVLHSDMAIFGAEAQLGLPERTVGIIPGWGGSTQLPRRIQQSGRADAVEKAFEIIAVATPIEGAFELHKRGILGTDDVITLSPDHALGLALEAAKHLAGKYVSPQPQRIQLSDQDLFWKDSEQSNNDERILAEVAQLYRGTSLDEFELSQRETIAAVNAFAHPDSHARAEAMLRTKRPLRN